MTMMMEPKTLLSIAALDAALKSLHLSGSIFDLALPTVYHDVGSFRLLAEIGLILHLGIGVVRNMDALAAGLERIGGWLRRQDAHLRTLPGRIKSAWCRQAANRLRKIVDWLEWKAGQ